MTIQLVFNSPQMALSRQLQVHCLGTSEHTTTALTIISLLSEQCCSLHLVIFLAISLVYIIEYRNFIAWEGNTLGNKKMVRKSDTISIISCLFILSWTFLECISSTNPFRKPSSVSILTRVYTLCIQGWNFIYQLLKTLLKSWAFEISNVHNCDLLQTV